MRGVGRGDEKMAISMLKAEHSLGSASSGSVYEEDDDQSHSGGALLHSQLSMLPLGKLCSQAKPSLLELRKSVFIHGISFFQKTFVDMYIYNIK